MEDLTYTDYALRIWRDQTSKSNIIHRGTADFNIIANESATIKFLTTDNLRFSINDTTRSVDNNLSVSGTTTLTGASTLNNTLTVAGTTTLNNTVAIHGYLDMYDGISYMGSTSLTINQNYTTNSTDTEIYGEHVCFGNTSATIQSGINNTNFLYGFYADTTLQIPMTILNASTS